MMIKIVILSAAKNLGEIALILRDPSLCSG
jgi:hypothetical protein